MPPVVCCGCRRAGSYGRQRNHCHSATFEEMTDRADLVFEGKVVSSRAEWRTVGTDRVIFTLVEFERQEVLKGARARQSPCNSLANGWRRDAGNRWRSKVQRRGSRVPLCRGEWSSVLPVVGVFHGKFGVRKDEQTGRDILVMHNGKPLRDVAEIGAGSEFGSRRPKLSLPAAGAPMSADDFKTKVRERLRMRAPGSKRGAGFTDAASQSHDDSRQGGSASIHCRESAAPSSSGH